MQVTLKKARKIQSELEVLANSYELSNSLKLSVYSDTHSDTIGLILDQKQIELQSNLDNYVNVISWVYNLRALVAEANKAAGIDKLMTALSLNEKVTSKVAYLVALEKVRSEEDESPSILGKKLETMKAALAQPVAASPYGRSTVTDYLLVTVNAKADDRLKLLKKAKVDLEDQLTALNALTKIEIAPELEAFLVSEGIV